MQIATAPVFSLPATPQVSRERRWLNEALKAKKPTVHVGVMVTPALAEMLLELNTKNRRKNDQRIRDWAHEMKNGRWVETHQCIAVGANGTLLDGQHRLSAVVKSGCSVQMRIAFGENPENFDRIDIGIYRRAGDTLSLTGHENGNKLAALIKLDQNLTRGNYARTFNLSNAEINSLAPGYEPEAQSAIRLGKKIYGGMKTAKSNIGLACALYRIGQVSSQDTLDAFVEATKTGLNIQSQDHPVYRLRSRISASDALGPELTAITIRAWNAWRENRKLGRLVWSPDSAFPQPVA